MVFSPGLQGQAILALVEPQDLAVALGSGDVPVVGTPRLVALIEAAAVDAIRQAVAPEMTTVGISVTLHHRAATLAGGRLTAEAMLDQVEGRRLAFRVRVWDAAGLVADGEHERLLVERDAFLLRARERAGLTISEIPENP